MKKSSPQNKRMKIVAFSVEEVNVQRKSRGLETI